MQTTGITTEPATETALRRPSAAEPEERGQKPRDRYVEAAAALKAEAGITQLTARKKMTDHASPATGAILAPAGTTRRQLYSLAHECGHIALQLALDLIIAYHKANKSPILNLLLSSVGGLIGAPS